jgi:5-methylcytosine-specific restriction endonuclease McrA
MRIEESLDIFKMTKLEQIKNEMAKQDYKLLSQAYQDNKEKLTYICPKGHEGTIKWNTWLSGARCRTCMYEKLSGEGAANWKGGLVNRNFVSHEVFAPQLGRSEITRPDPEEPTILQAKCNYCGKWFRPSRSAIKGRLIALNSSDAGEIRLYCSKECKRECPVFWKRLYPQGFKKATSREVQPDLRQMVFERDEWVCQRCGRDISLNCHHIESISRNPIESADIDNCITLCKRCHKWAHSQEGCRYFELRCLK